MPRMVCLCFAVFLWCSCSHIHYLDSMSEAETQAFEKRAAKKSFSVLTHDGRSFDGKDLVVEADTVIWNDLVSGKRNHLFAGEVQQIDFTSILAGVSEGLLIGFAIGALVGGVLGYVSGEDCGDNPPLLCISREGGAILGVVIIGVPAAIVGGFFGLRGCTHVYYPTSVESLETLSQSREAEIAVPPD